MTTLFQDIRYAFRQLRKSPGFTLTVIVTLALGIGANTAIFTLVHGIMLSSLPVADPEQIYRIGDNDDCCVEGGFPGGASDNGDFTIFSYDLYQYLRANTPEFEQLAGMQAGLNRWSVRRGDALAKSLSGEYVSGNYFGTLGINSYIGRLFADADDSRNAAPAAVLSYEAWQGDYAADPSIVGSTIYIQAKPFTVIGVTPKGFYGDRIRDTPPAIWLPLNAALYLDGTSSYLPHAEAHWIYPLGRVRKGTNVGALQTKITALLQQWLYTQPEITADGGLALVPKMHVVLTPGGGGIQNLQQQAGQGLKMLMILSSAVLLIACANIANLMLARSTARRSEIAVRMALGSGRGRVMRQILTESILLSFLGGLAGLAVAYAGSKAILALAFPEARNLPVSASPSLEVLGFAFLASLATGILFGTGPAWLSSHAQPADVLRGSSRGGGSSRDRSSVPQKALVIVQAALSLVLLAGAILMTKSLANLEHQDFGVVTTNRYVVHFDPAGAGYTLDRVPGLYKQIEDRFSALPGVKHIGMGLYSPLEGDNWGECVIPQGHPAPRPGDKCGATWDRVNSQFLESIGVPIVQGRGFATQDTASSPQVVLVNEAFAKRHFPNQNPIGQHFGIDHVEYSSAWQIVGVFRDFKMNNPREAGRPVYLRPLTQVYTAYKEASMISGEQQSMFINSMVIEFNQPQQNADGLIRQTLASIDPNLTVADLRTFNAQVTGNFAADNLLAKLTGLFGILSLILASVGLYGVMSYFVVRRTSEIGIRMALGASRSSVTAMVMRDVLWQLLTGLAIGIPCALYVGYLMKSLLYGVAGYDWTAIAGAPLLLTVCALGAGFLPARRAASIEPMTALRAE